MSETPTSPPDEPAAAPGADAAPPPAEERQETGEPTPPVANGGARLLRRSRSDRVIAGVCGGLGRYLGIDPVLLRIATVVLVFAGGIGILLYVIGWIVIPEERPGVPEPEPAPSRVSSRVAVGLVFIAVGAFFLLDEVWPDVFDWRYVGPGLLIVIGAVLLARRR